MCIRDRAERDGADYIGVGAVFSTNTKKNTKKMCIRDRYIVESKSLKLYLFGFRNNGDFHEDCVNIIKQTKRLTNLINDLVALARGGEIEKENMKLEDVDISQVTETIAGDFRPVSYTHLDVYKRQVQRQKGA